MSNSKETPVVVVERGGLGHFIVGLAVGAAAALLFAPKSGEETRLAIRNQSRRVKAIAGEKAEELQERFEGGYEKTKQRVEEGIASAREKLDEKKDSAREAVDAGRAAVQSARDELDRRLTEARADRKGTKAEAESAD